MKKFTFVSAVCTVATFAFLITGHLVMAQTTPDAQFSTTFSNASLLQQTAPSDTSKYVLQATAKVINNSNGAIINPANAAFPAYFVKITGSNGTSIESAHNAAHAFGSPFTFTETNLSLPPPYTYQLSITYQGQKKVVSSPQTIALTGGADSNGNQPFNPAGSPQGTDSEAFNPAGSPESQDQALELDSTSKHLLENPLKVNSIQELIAEILKVILIIAIPVIAIFIVIAGFRYVMARGQPSELEVAHRNILFVIVGAGLIIGCVLIVDVITTTINDIKADVQQQ